MRVYLLVVNIFIISFSMLVQNIFCQDTSVEFEEIVNRMKADREKRAKTPYLQHNEKNLQIAVQKNVFAPMESIDVTYTIKNTALETRIYFYSGLLFHTECCIKGNEIQPPCNEISPFSPTPSKFMMELIEPDQIFWDYTKIINHEHDMTLAGEYRIQMFHVDRNNFVKPQFLIKSADNNSQDNTNKADFFDEKYKAEWVKSNIITVKVDDSLIDISKVIPLQSPRVYSKPLHGVSISLVSDKRHYENYGPVCLRVSTKNVSHDSVSMIVDAKNVLDVYELVLLTPGRNRDFRKPAAKDKNDVQKVAYTLYGKKLLSEKSKTPKKTISVKPNEETAESVIVLNRIFDMSADGIYGLIVTRKIIDAAGKEQTILSEPFPIRIGQSSTQDEIDESRRQHILNGYDPDYPTWQSRDGLFKVIAKFISVDKNKDIVTLEKPDGKQTTFNISELTAENQNYIEKQIQKNNNNIN